MVFLNDNDLWNKEFDNIVSTKDKVQNINLKQLKLKVNDIYKEDGKITTIFEASDDIDKGNKSYFGKNLCKIEGRFSYIEKVYNEFKLHHNN